MKRLEPEEQQIDVEQHHVDWFRDITPEVLERSMEGGPRRSRRIRRKAQQRKPKAHFV